jgi:hypothetical protein
MFRSWCLALVALGGFSLTPAMAQAMDCPGMEPTIESLQACVQHAADSGAIDNAGVARSLLAKLHSAELAAVRDNPNAYWTAINVLGAFIGEAEAQSGKHIDAQHAEHMAMHARMVIDALRAAAAQRASSPG